VTKFEKMFPGKTIHCGDNDPKMLPKSVYVGETHLCDAICNDAAKCALAQAFQDGDYKYDDVRVGWLHTFIVKKDDVYVYRTPKYTDKKTGKEKSIAREFDEAGGASAQANNTVRPARVPPGVYAFYPLIRQHRSNEEIQAQKETDRQRTLNGGISKHSRDDKDGYIRSLRKLAINKVPR
jgi:hypothetical protein